MRGRVACVLAGLGVATAAGAAEARDFAGVKCETPPAFHCPATGCTAELIRETGNAVDAKTGRKYFLDYPCDLKPGEKVTFVLNLHGGGSIGNWQRHYFPIVDLKEKYRLVIATPSGTGGGWRPDPDDAHLRGIVEQVYAAFGPDNIKAFWLAGHSLGGQTSNRLIMTDPVFRDRLTGWVSLSGGRLGSKREEVRAPIPAGAAAPPPGATPGGPMRLVADASVLPEKPFSHIYSSGEHELTAAGLPGESKWAQKLGCGPQAKAADVVDTKAGYVQDSRPRPNPNKIWGLAARPGTARVFLYPNCADGRVAADVIRLDKGHTEGLEPNVTEEIVKLMMAAR
jgi:pimeloyl-ACP methyl ester carboxylesterase